MTTDQTVRGPWLTARIGLVLGVCFAICFATGMLSHWIQHPPEWFWWPAHPAWLYRITQGAHVITGVASIPLLLAKLAAVYPKLFERPLIGSPARLLERLSIAVLVSAAIFEVLTGIMNIAQWYPWRFFFTTTHHAMAFVVIGALLVHIAVKLPVIREALDRGGPIRDTAVVDEDAQPTPVADVSVGTSRRTILRTTWAAAALGAVAVAGQTVRPLRSVAFLAPRSGTGPQGLPVNRTAGAAGVLTSAADDAYRLSIVRGNRVVALSATDLARLPQRTVRLPIACVEGWSVSAEWSGVVLRDLVGLVGGDPDRGARMVSLERGPYGVSDIPAVQTRDELTLIALRLNGERLDMDHGYPCRLIAPNLPGVMQTKWLSRIEVR